MTHVWVEPNPENSHPGVNPPPQAIAPEVSPHAPSAEQCAAELMETIPLIMQFIRAEIRDDPQTLLSLQQFRVLAFLSRHPSASLSAVAHHLGVTGATASTMTERLVKQGYIHRTDNPQERRQVHLNLTETGNQHLQAVKGTIRQKIAGLLTSLTPEELATVYSGLSLLSQKFSPSEFKFV